MDLLRLITCGSVDNGKSTLIGRMLYDSQAVQTDLLKAIQEASLRNGKAGLDLSLLTDGLKSEREQGITIDVAYKYFGTEKRKFIIADAPGHVQYTRNMVTGASTSQLAILLVDARLGIVDQTRRHTYIVSLLRLPHIVLAINKMDLVDYSQECYERIRNDFMKVIESFHYEIDDVTIIPVNALDGDNVVKPSEKMTWYTGKPLLEHLSSVKVEYDENIKETRFPVQGVIRPQNNKEFPDYRGYSGRVNGGILSVGDEVQVLSTNNGQSSYITKIMLGKKELQTAYPPSSVTLLLKDDIDISRGDMIIGKKSGEKRPISSQEFIADICWMGTEALEVKKKYILYHGNQELSAIVTKIIYQIDMSNLNLINHIKKLELNDLGRIYVKTQKVIHFDPYSLNRRTGSFIFVDSGNFSTVAAGMIVE